MYEDTSTHLHLLEEVLLVHQNYSSIQFAWQEVAPTTIASTASNNDGLKHPKSLLKMSDDDPDDDLPLADLAKRQRKAGMAVTDDEMEAFDHVDDYRTD